MVCELSAARSMWDRAGLFATPRVWEDPDHSTVAAKAVFFEGLPWRGRATRVFAHYGLPELEPGKTCPAMVLVHGGGGSAFADWVQRWVARGYAAISMDTCGCISAGPKQSHLRHEHGGPPGWGGFAAVDEPPQEQWTYHAVADVLLAHSLIRAFPQVDPARVGLTGISWGGYLTCIAAAADPRFRFAASVYGCGFLGDNSVWLPEFEKLGADRASRWLRLWDPSRYLPEATMPMLWVTGTNDFAYPPDSLQKSYRLPPGERTLCVRVAMDHGHGPGQRAPEIQAYADAMLGDGVPLARITGGGRTDGEAWVDFESVAMIERAELCFTCDAGAWQERKWETRPATVDHARARASASVPAGATVCYLNLIDERGLVVSGEHEELPA